MQLRFGFILVATALGGCAGPILNEYTEYLGPTIGSLEEQQVLRNLARFVNNPWTIPGHVELASGQIQATNMLGVNLKYPYSKVIAPSGAATTTIGNEFDVNPAQTQDQESYTLLPVTDNEDLRRLRAIYHYAICPNPLVFRFEWEIADQFIFNPPRIQKTAAKTSTPRPKDVIHKLVQDFIDKKNATDSETVLRGINSEFHLDKKEKSERDSIEKDIDDVLRQTRSSPPTMNAEQATNAIVVILGNHGIGAAAPAAAAAAKATAAAKDTTTGSDTIVFEQKRGAFIVSPGGLGTSRWLYWRGSNGQISGYCPGTGLPPELPPDPGRLIRLGSAGGYEFFTDDPKKFSDLILFLLGAIPNTVGSHVLDAGLSKAGRQQFFSIGGQTGVIIPSKSR